MLKEEVLIPKSRVAVLIGTGGKVKKDIERKGKVKISFDENTVMLTSEDAFNIWTTKKIVEAIGRGFNPEVAKLLFRDEYDYCMLDISDFARTDKRIRVVRGRVIGEKGTTKKKLQEYTNTSISVFGKTIGIIGKTEDVQLARQALEMIIEGAKQTTAYFFLEKQKQEDHSVQQQKINKPKLERKE